MPKSPIIEHWFRGYESPMKAVVLAMREILHAADPRLEEQLKWQSPTFVLGGGHLASFFPRSRDHARLMFPMGARIPGDYPHLEVSGDASRVMRVRSLDEVEEVRAELTALVHAWARLRLAESERPPAPTRKSEAKAESRPKPGTKSKSGTKSKAGAESKSGTKSKSGTGTGTGTGTGMKSKSGTGTKSKSGTGRKSKRSR